VFLSIKANRPVVVNGSQIPQGVSQAVQVLFDVNQAAISLSGVPVEELVGTERVEIEAVIVPDSAYVVDLARTEHLIFDRTIVNALDYVSAFATNVSGSIQGVLDLSRIDVEEGSEAR
jgi:hypothetical protein